MHVTHRSARGRSPLWRPLWQPSRRPGRLYDLRAIAHRQDTNQQLINLIRNQWYNKMNVIQTMHRPARRERALFFPDFWWDVRDIVVALARLAVSAPSTRIECPRRSPKEAKIERKKIHITARKFSGFPRDSHYVTHTRFVSHAYKTHYVSSWLIPLTPSPNSTLPWYSLIR